MKSLMIKKTFVYGFDPVSKKPVKMGQKIGNVFYKTVKPMHFMRVVGGYGLQYDAFACFEEEGITKIEIKEQATGVDWLSAPTDWLLHGRIADYGRGKQIFLSLKYMSRKNKEAIKEARAEAELERAQINSQLNLL